VTESRQENKEFVGCAIQTEAVMRDWVTAADGCCDGGTTDTEATPLMMGAFYCGPNPGEGAAPQKKMGAGMTVCARMARPRTRLEAQT
jgi:hypothetical protein